MTHSNYPIAIMYQVHVNVCLHPLLDVGHVLSGNDWIRETDILAMPSDKPDYSTYPILSQQI